VIPVEQTREDVVAARTAFREAVAHIRAENLVFLDESGIATNLVRAYARAPRGERANGTAPYGRWERLTVFGAVSLTGFGACMTLDGAADTDAMLAFVQHVLTPTLVPGQVVVLDNLNVHKAARVRDLIEAAGCTLIFLPPYSPDFNPIEQAWSKLKALLRGIGAHTKDTLQSALHDVLDAITATDAHGWFGNCGYASN